MFKTIKQSMFLINQKLINFLVLFIKFKKLCDIENNYKFYISSFIEITNEIVNNIDLLPILISKLSANALELLKQKCFYSEFVVVRLLQIEISGRFWYYMQKQKILIIILL